MMYKIIFILLLSLFFTQSLVAQQWKVQKQEIPEIQLATENRFGSAMASDSSGNIVVVGAPEEDAGAVKSGAVYVYERNDNTYKLLKKLTPTDPFEKMYFGRAVSIDDSTIVIGAPSDNRTAWVGGSAYIFKKGKAGWQDASQIKKIAPNDLAEYSLFGSSVAVKQNTILISSPDRYQTENTASVYVYEMNNSEITLAAKLKPSSYTGKLKPTRYSCIKGCSTEFGHSVAIGDKFIAVSAPKYDIYTHNDGGIFIYNKPQNGWIDATESTILHLPDTVLNAEIGLGLAFQDNLLYVGARGPYEGKGYSYFFERDTNGWKTNPIAVLKANANVGILGPSSVRLTDKYAVLSSTQSFGKNNETYGGVFIFTKPENGWKDANHDFVVHHKDSLDDILFGISVLAVGDTLLIGAPNDNRPSVAAGSVFQITKSGDAWRNENLTRWETPREENASNYIFGDDVSIYENIMVVGAPKDNTYGAAYVYEKQNGNWTKVAKLSAKEGKEQDGFGFSVNIFEDYIIVGAPYVDDSRGTSVGAAYLFEKPAFGWRDMHETAKFTASDTTYRFGAAVDLTDSFAVVGVRERISPHLTGGVYVFEKTSQGWVSKTEDVRLHDYFVKDADLFGYTLDCNESGVLVSLPSKNKAYLFEKSHGQWDVENPVIFELPSIDLAIGIRKAYFLSVSLSKNVAVIGWPYDIKENTWGVGTVYIYYRTPNGAWQTQPYILEPPSLKAAGFFGADVDIDNELLVVGANGGYSNDVNQRQPGSAYVYARNSRDWYLIDSLSATHPTPGDMFGLSVGISGTDFVIGAPHDTNEVGYRAGSAYIFNHYGPWIEQVSSIQKDGWYGIGQDLFIDVHYDSIVYINGTPTLNLYLDQKSHKAHYMRGTGTTKLTFQYTIQEGHHSSDLGYNGVFALDGSLFGKDSVRASTLLPSPGRQSSLKGNKDLRIDGKRPLINGSHIDIDSISSQSASIQWIVDERIQQIDSTLVEVLNGRLLSVTQVDSVKFITYIQPNDGQVKVRLKEGVVKDKASNAALETEVNFWYDDQISPTVSITAHPVESSDTTFSVIIATSEPVRNFSLKDIEVQNASLSQLQTADSIIFLAELTTLNEEEIKIIIPKNKVYDKAGNSNLTSESLTLFYDASPPVIAQKQQFEVRENAAVGTVLGKLVAEETVGRLQNWRIDSGNGFGSFNVESINGEIILAGEIDFEKQSEYILTVTVSNGVNTSEPVAVIINIIDVDEVSPAVIITSKKEDTVSGSFIVSIVLSEVVQGFSALDITVQNGILTHLHTNDSITFTAEIIATQEGDVVVIVPKGAIEDQTGNKNEVDQQLVFYYDSKSPTVALNSTEGDTTYLQDFPVNIIFSEKVSNFSTSDIQIDNASITGLVTEDSINFVAEVSALREGVIVVNILSNIAQDRVGNGNAEAVPFLVVYQVPGEEPLNALLSAESDTVSGDFLVEITFNRAVSNFSLSNIEVQNGYAMMLTTTDSTFFLLKVKPNAFGEMKVSLLEKLAFSNKVVIFFEQEIVADIVEVNWENEIMVYPIPASEQITIEVNLTNQASASVILTNSVGKVVYHKMLYGSGNQQSQVNISHLPSGAYMAIISVDGQRVIRKFIKK